MQPACRFTMSIMGCLLLLVAAIPANATQFLSTSIQSQLTHAHMSPDLFRRLGAIGRDAQQQHIPIGRTLHKIWSNMHKPSIEATAKALQQHANIKKLLEQHGLSAQQFVIGTLLLERSQYAAAGLIDKDKLNADNLQFYHQQKQQADHLLAQINKASGATDNDSAAHDSTLKDLRELKAMDAKMLGECTELGLVVAQAAYSFHSAHIDTLHPKLSGAQHISSDDIVAISKNLHDLLIDIPQRKLKGYVSTMSKEIKRQAHNRPIQETPAYLQAAQGYSTWMDAHCTKKALAQ